MLLKGLFLTLLGLGVFVLMQVVTPFLAFKAWEVFALDQNQLLVDPHAGSINYQENVLGVSIENLGDFPAFVTHDPSAPAPYADFKLSVPSINLSEVLVKTNSNNFDENLAQLPGTAFPGERGNVFISGHSSVVENFQLGSPQKAWFVDLPKIKKGDTITVEVLGQSFVYTVSGLKIVDPKDIGVIKPPDNEGRYLTLMTCVPPGFNAKRLIVLAKLR